MEYTREQIKKIFIDKLNSHKFIIEYQASGNYPSGQYTDGYIDDSFENVFDCVVQTIEELTGNNNEAIVTCNGGDLNTAYLMSVHKELTYKSALSLLRFSEANGIRYRECYGNGGIMYPLWLSREQ